MKEKELIYRDEVDYLGVVKVQSENLWGAVTERGRKMYAVTDETVDMEIVRAVAMIKKAAAIANEKLGVLSTEKRDRISLAVDQILTGKFDDNFPLSVYQTGSGTATNMNVNEVIKNINNLGLIGDDSVSLHPNDDVNKSQSTNCVFPTAINVAVILNLKKGLIPALENLVTTLDRKIEEFDGVIKIGRTHLEDATPILISDEFRAYRDTFMRDIEKIKEQIEYLSHVPLGGTAVGTGLNTPPGYDKLAVEALGEIAGVDLIPMENKFMGLSMKNDIATAYGAIASLAMNLFKFLNDIRLMQSGPRAGFSEIIIPANEPGSSIMPGKVNPTQIEMLTQIALRVYGANATILFASGQGNFELNVYMPLIANQFIKTARELANGIESFNENCLKGIKLNGEKIEKYLEQSLMLVTALNPHIGYINSAKIAKNAYEKGITLKQSALELELLTEEKFDIIVDPTKMV